MRSLFKGVATRGVFTMVFAAAIALSLAVTAYAAVSHDQRTPRSLLTAARFPVGSQATVDFASAVNVRSGPGNEYEPFATVRRGETVRVSDFRLGWVNIQTSRGQGWMYSAYLTNDPIHTARRAYTGAPPAAAFRDTYSGARAPAAAQTFGRPTPSSEITAAMFPVGQGVTIDYTSSLNVRRGPDNSYAAFTTVPRGATFTVREYDRKWVRIDSAQGQGWVFAGYLR